MRSQMYPPGIQHRWISRVLLISVVFFIAFVALRARVAVSVTSFWEGVYALAEAENFVPDQSWGGTSYQRSNSVGLGTLEAPAFFHAAAQGMYSQIAANQTSTISRSDGKTELSIDG